MITKTVLPFKLETTSDTMAAHAGLALLGEFAEGIGLPSLVNRHLPLPGSGAGYVPSEFVMPCGQFWANDVFFRLGVLAYNLFRIFEMIRRRIRVFTMA